LKGKPLDADRGGRAKSSLAKALNFVGAPIPAVSVFLLAQKLKRFKTGKTQYIVSSRFGAEL
jgi:hypothetical protein